MPTKIVALFNLKPGISASEYEAWAKSTDMPTVGGLKSIDAFGVFRAVSLLGSDAEPPYAYIEIIDVNDMDQFGADVSTDAMQEIAAKFQSMTDDLVFILTDKLG